MQIVSHKRFPFIHLALDQIQVNAGGGHLPDQIEVGASLPEMEQATAFIGGLTVLELNQFAIATGDGLRVGQGRRGWAEANQIVNRFYEER